jgi:glyoxylase-like metal-dependent hydrolase (beta-lactamase superfamily II)
MLSDNLITPGADLLWKIGPFEVDLFRLGLFGMDGGTTFGVVPKPLWERSYPHADEQNRVRLATHALLVRGNGLTIVADAGIGDKLNEKLRGIFAVEQMERALPRALEARGIAVEEVTHFVYTHLHFDHCGGATEFGPDGRLGPVFPKAKYLVQAAQLSWANSPSDKDKASFLPENWDSVVDSGQLVELNGDHPLAPGIDLRVVHGHTPGMMMVVVHDAESGLLWTVDLFPTAAHLPPHYVAAADNHPLASLDEKRYCLEEVEGRGWVLAPGHDPYTAPGKVERDAMGRWRLPGAAG